MKDPPKEQNCADLIAACQPDDPMALCFRKTNLNSLDEVKRLVALKQKHPHKIILDFVVKEVKLCNNYFESNQSESENI